jgi:hypothetical protein
VDTVGDNSVVGSLAFVLRTESPDDPWVTMMHLGHRAGWTRQISKVLDTSDLTDDVLEEMSDPGRAQPDRGRRELDGGISEMRSNVVSPAVRSTLRAYECPIEKVTPRFTAGATHSKTPATSGAAVTTLTPGWSSADEP